MSKNKVTGASRGPQLLFVMKEINAIEKNPNLNNTTRFIIDEKDLSRFNVIIKPIEGLYIGLEIHFELYVPENYPAPGNPIQAKCLDPIYHPNIFEEGRLCLYYDNVGNYETGYKETLENLIVALNYLFIHPGNQSVDMMKESDKQTFIKNIKEYKKMKAENSSNKSHVMKEVYGDDINCTLTRIPEWASYFPPSCSSKQKGYRFFMITLGGKKIMNIETLESVLSQIIRDPRYRFDTVQNIAMIKDKTTIDIALTPETPYSIVLCKNRRLTYLTDIQANQIKNVYVTTYTLNNLIARLGNDNKSNNIYSRMSLMCNVVIKSNYEFSFTCQKNNDCLFTIMKSKPIQENGRIRHIMTIDQFLCFDADSRNNKFIVLTEYPKPECTPWFDVSYASLILGQGILTLFDNIAFRLDPSDPTTPYITFNKNSLHGKKESSLRLLTDHELKMIKQDVKPMVDNLVKDSDSSIEINESDDEYDIELAKKYIASNERETGLDLSRMRYIS